MSMTNINETGTVVEKEACRQSLKPPAMYRVVLLNDDYTPMDFVVMVLQDYFHKPEKEAVHIMLNVHHHGKGVCGIFSKDIASTKVFDVMRRAEQLGHPLRCTMEAL